MEQNMSDARSGKLSSHLSPRAKREMLLSPADKRIAALVSVTSSMDRGRFRQAVKQIGGDVVTWSDTTDLVNITIPAGALDTLAGMEGVVYVETGGHYGK
jgi:hypothetical protein